MLTDSRRRPPRWALIAVLSALALIAVPALAQADTVSSDNWSGFAIHRSKVDFRSVTGTWIQPAGDCATSTQTAYSSFWVGIGGYSESSQALEQIGTELDCAATGVSEMSAWYELVPQSSRTIKTLDVAAGDELTATVSILGTKVTLSLDDVTRHESFTKTITDSDLDVTSAEWIAEAPSQCTTSNDCQTLPLADFGAVDFSRTTAETTTGARGTIVSSHWNDTKILLGYRSQGDQKFIADTSTATVRATLGDADGSRFTATYAGATTTSTGTGGGGGFGGGGGWGGGPGGPGSFTSRL